MDKRIDWIPSKRQAEFLAVPYTVKEALYGGGVNSAKTETLIYYPLIHKFHENPRFKQVILRRTYPELNREVVPRAKRIYKPFGAKYNGTDKVFTFPSGAQVWLGHCENEDDVHKYDSMEINLFSPDELTSFLEFQYVYIALQRVRSPLGSDLPAIIRAGGMPGDIGHSWVKKRFIDPYTNAGITDLYECSNHIITGRGGNKRIYIHATVADNPYADPEYVKSLDGLPEAEKQAKKYGKWDAYLGSVFDEFRDKHYPDEPDNALHVIEPFVIPDYWPKIVVGDWGYSAYTWIGYGAIAPDKRLYIYREQYWKRTKIADWAPLVRLNIEKENPKLIKFCKSAGQDRGQEQTIQQQIEDSLGCAIDLTNNSPGSRISGKMLLHEFLRWRTIPRANDELKVYNHQYALWIMRNKGIVDYNNYLKEFNTPEPEAAIPRLQIFKDCTLLISAIKLCQYAKASGDRPVEDVAEFDGDDPYDGIRYMIDAANKYVEDAQYGFQRVQQQAEIENEFKESGDYNLLFRRAQAQERIAIGPKAVRRFH